MENDVALKTLLQALIVFGTIVSSLVLPGLWNSTVYGHRVQDEAAREAGGEESPFGGPGSLEENSRIGVVVGFPLVSLFCLLLAARWLEPPWEGELLLLALSVLFILGSYRFFLSALDLPEESEDVHFRSRVVIWYRRRVGWMIAGMYGVLLAEFFYSTPERAYVAVHLAFATLFYYWSVGYFLDTALPPRTDALYQQRNAQRAGRAEMFPARMALLLYITTLMLPWTIGEARAFIPLPGEHWICYMLVGAWLARRAGVQSRVIEKNFGGRRVSAARRSVSAVRSLVSADNEMTAGMEHEEKLAWKPVLRYRQAPQEGGGPWDLLWEGLGLWAAALLPVLALLPHVQLMGRPAFWMAAGCAVLVVACPFGGRPVRMPSVVLVSSALCLGAWLGPALVPWTPVVSCIALLLLRMYLDSGRTRVPMVAAGREGRWWIVRIPRALSAPVAVPHPVGELPGTGWQPLGEADLVPWSPLWRPPEADWGRLKWSARSGVPVLAVALLLSAVCLRTVPHLRAGTALTHPTGWTVGRMLAAGDLEGAWEQLSRANATAGDLPGVLLMEAQFNRDAGGSLREVWESVAEAVRAHQGWLPGRAARLVVGLSREAGLRVSAADASPAEMVAGLDRPQQEALALARELEGVEPASLGYASERALCLRVLRIAEREFRGTPRSQHLRDYWWGRMQLLQIEENRLGMRLRDEPRVTVLQTFMEGSSPGRGGEAR